VPYVRKIIDAILQRGRLTSPLVDPCCNGPHFIELRHVTVQAKRYLHPRETDLRCAGLVLQAPGNMQCRIFCEDGQRLLVTVAATEDPESFCWYRRFGFVRFSKMASFSDFGYTVGSPL